MNLGERGVGKSLGQIGDDPEGLLQGADGQQTGVGDDASAVESDVDLLRTDDSRG